MKLIKMQHQGNAYLFFWLVVILLVANQVGFGVACLKATVGAILQLLLSCSNTSSPANQSSFSKLLCSPSLLPPKSTDSTFFCFSISSASPMSIFTLLGLGSVSTLSPHRPSLSPFACQTTFIRKMCFNQTIYHPTNSYIKTKILDG